MAKKGRPKKEPPKVGRQEGSKNIQRKGSKVINQHGVKLTAEEEKHFVNLVNSANRKAKRMHDEYLSMERMKNGEPTGTTIGETLAKSGRETDFMLAQRSKSVNRFKDKWSFNREVKRLEKVVQRDYMDKQTEKYKKNFIKALRSELAEGKENKAEVKKIIEAVKGMDTATYFRKVQTDERMEIKTIYSPEQRAEKIDSLKNALSIE